MMLWFTKLSLTLATTTLKQKENRVTFRGSFSGHKNGGLFSVT
jgi:hypothetical protein